MTPQRIQLKRTARWTLQAASRALNGLDAVKVDRSGPWGNPFKVGQPYQPAPGAKARPVVRDAAHAVELFTALLADRLDGPGDIDALVAVRRIRHDLAQLRGKNLACWCKPGTPCHADVLLELANRPLFLAHADPGPEPARPAPPDQPEPPRAA